MKCGSETGGRKRALFSRCDWGTGNPTLCYRLRGYCVHQRICWLEAVMENRMVRLLLLAILVVLGVIAAQPYLEQRFFSATAPRLVEARGDLSDFERSMIGIFE